MLLLGLYIPDHAVLPSICPSEFMVGGNEPSVYMQCCSWNLSGWVRWYIKGRGVALEFSGGGGGVDLGAFVHALENLTL